MTTPTTPPAELLREEAALQALVVPAPMASQAEAKAGSEPDDIVEQHETLGTMFAEFIRRAGEIHHELGEIRATLLVNFGEGSKHARHGFTVKRDQSTMRILLAVLEHYTKPSASQPPASDSPASRSMGWVADDLATIEEALEFYADRDSWRVPLDDSGNGLPAAEDEGKFAREALPALARLVKSLPPPPGQEAPAPVSLDEKPPVHFDQGKDMVCGDEGVEDETFTEDIERVTCLACLRTLAQLAVDDRKDEDEPSQPAPVSSSASPSPEVIAEAVEAFDFYANKDNWWDGKPVRWMSRDKVLMPVGWKMPLAEKGRSVSHYFPVADNGDVARAILPKLKAQQQPATPSTPPTEVDNLRANLEVACEELAKRSVELTELRAALAQQAPSIQTPDTKGDSPCR